MRLISLLLLLLPGAAMADVFPIKSPSGNIECSVGLERNHADIYCTIHNKSGTPPRARPAGCPGAWGHNFSMLQRGPVTMECGGPGAKNTAPGVWAIPYGTAERFGEITCTSERTGFECRNADGHGFFLSRRKQKAF